MCEALAAAVPEAEGEINTLNGGGGIIVILLTNAPL
jgi:hypothetical protein